MKKYVAGLLVFGLVIGTVFAAIQVAVHSELIKSTSVSIPLAPHNGYVKVICLSAITANPAFTNVLTWKYTNNLVTTPSILVGPITYTGSWYYTDINFVFDPSTVFLISSTDTNGVVSYGYEVVQQ